MDTRDNEFKYDKVKMDYAINLSKNVSGSISGIEGSIKAAKSAFKVGLNVPSFNSAMDSLSGVFTQCSNLSGTLIEMKNIAEGIDKKLSANTNALQNASYSLVTLESGQQGWLYIPEGHSSTNGLPLVVNLNGMGEMAKSDRKISGYAEVIQSGYDVDAVVWIPVSKKDGIWDYQSNSVDSEYYQSAAAKSRNGKANATIVSCEELVSKYNLDSDRISIYGNSMGAHGTYQYLANYPNYFSTAVTWGGFAHGYADIDLVAQSGTTMIMMYGSSDGYIVGHTGRTPDEYEYIKENGGQAVLYEIVDANHADGDYEFNPALINDMLSIKKGQKLSVPDSKITVSLDEVKLTSISEGNAEGENHWYHSLS